MNWLWLVWAFRGPKAADKKINNCTHCPVWAFRGQRAAVNKINNGTHPESQKKTFHIIPQCNTCNVSSPALWQPHHNRIGSTATNDGPNTQSCYTNDS